MKKNLIAFTAILLLAVFLFSCKKEPTPVIAENSNPPASILTQGKANIQHSDLIVASESDYWIIGSCIINGNDVTANYRYYRFQFLGDELMTAKQKETINYGRWFTTGENHLSIYFDTSELTDLNEDWTVSRITAKSITLNINNTLKTLRLDLDPKKGVF